MADKKNVLIVIKVFKRAQEKQSESLSKPCTITVKYSFRAAARKMGHFVTQFFLLEKNT